MLGDPGKVKGSGAIVKLVVNDIVLKEMWNENVMQEVFACGTREEVRGTNIEFVRILIHQSS